MTNGTLTPGTLTPGPSRQLLGAGALLGATGVMLGAFGAHALKTMVEASRVATWNTAVEYQLFHAVALIALAAIAVRDGPLPAAWLRRAGWCLVAGTCIFSGSLYGLVLDGPRWLGPVTPVGGVVMIAGWMLVALGAWRGARGEP